MVMDKKKRSLGTQPLVFLFSDQQLLNVSDVERQQPFVVVVVVVVEDIVVQQSVVLRVARTERFI
jgi:hypothetical protein